MFNIVLADIQNAYYNITRNSIPINIGYIAEYADVNLDVPRSIYLTRKVNELFDYLSNNKVDVVGLGFFSWNHSLVMKTANEIKRLYPDSLIVFGGPSVNENLDLSCNIFRECFAVDYLIANEGEQPFLNLLNAYLEDPSALRSGAMEVVGCFGRIRATGQLHGHAQERFEGDINTIPSPYLSGRMDKFLTDKLYLPIVQTCRGCPYSCTFCVSGKRSWNKLRNFSIERIRREFEYIQLKSASTYLRLADENFGVQQRDVEVAALLRDMKDRSGYPDSISIYTDKHPSDRVLEINKTLSDILPFNISFQTMTASVLKNIKRVNISDDRINVALRFAEENGLMLVTELIFGLPGETIDSFFASLDKVVRLRFESVLILQLYILKGSEMDTPAHREQYGVKTKFMISENGYTEYQSISNVEVDEWVTETNTINATDYALFNKTILMFDFIHGYGFARELMILFESLGVEPSTLLKRLACEESGASLLNKYATSYMERVDSMLKTTKEEAVDCALKEIESDIEHRMTGVIEAKMDIMIDIIVSDHLNSVLNEIARVGATLVADDVRKLLPQNWEEILLKETVEFCLASVVDVEGDLGDIYGEYSYNFVDWKRGKYSGAPMYLDQPQSLKFTVASKLTIHNIIVDVSDIRSRFRKFFSVTNSRTNRRLCEVVN